MSDLNEDLTSESYVPSGRHSKRALILLGAGASVEYGLGATGWFGDEIEKRLRANEYCVKSGGLRAFLRVRRALKAYYGKDHQGEAHFERIYHALHELAELVHPVNGAVPRYKPVLKAFLQLKRVYEPIVPNAVAGTRDFDAACQAMIEAIYDIASKASDTLEKPIDNFASFFASMRQEYVVRTYTTNYDDFALQAAPDLYTGFTVPHASGTYFHFDEQEFWRSWNLDSLFHLHGSVHFGWPGIMVEQGKSFTELAWFPSRKDALLRSSYTGSGVERMDGTSIHRTAVITGLDKLHRLQEIPFNHYYSALARDAVDANVIIVLGSGLMDLHLNSWLAQARRKLPSVPLLFVGYWESDEDFYNASNFDLGDREIYLIHELRIPMPKLRHSGIGATEGWTIFSEDRAAVWHRGFQSFLENPKGMKAAMSAIGA